MGKTFMKCLFTPRVYVQNDQRILGIILRYGCRVTHRLPPWRPRRLTGRPTYPPPPSPPVQTPESFCTQLRSRI